MKQLSLFLLLVLLLAGGLRPTRAQAQTTDSLSQKLASIFANVDKSVVPTGYLYEAGVRLIEPRFYNGVLSDSNRTDMNVLRYLRAQLRSSRVYGTDTLPSLSAFNARVKAATVAANGAIPIAMQYMPYASIRPDALQNNLLRAQGEQLFDVPGRPYGPYQTNSLFAAAPDLAYSRTSTVSFLFRRNLCLTGNGQVPTNLSLDFGDGRGYQPVTWGQPISTTYATSGSKRVKVKAYFVTDIYWSLPYESHFDFQVLSSASIANRYDPKTGFSKYVGPPGYRYGATMSVRYGTGHGARIVKPFIVVEQYNIAKAAPHLVDCNNADNTSQIFEEKIFSTKFISGTSFNDALQAAGYDLVYIDFENNTDDITRNARVFERVLQEVRIYKNSAQAEGYTTQPNVVMGMSMGGLIARYGLAEMTKNNSLFGPPDTRLLVLHDSPQRGAYNPVGLQSFTRSTDVPLNIFEFLKLRDLDDRLDDAVNVLDEPASKQLAILNALNGRGDIRANTFIDGVYKNMIDFKLPANTSGPQPAYPIIATSDGSQCGRGSGAPLGVLLSSADTYTSGVGRLLQLIPYLGRFSLGVQGAAYGLPAYGQQATISRMRVYIEYRIVIGRCPFCISIPIRFNLLNENATSPPNTLPYETLPGGTTNLSRESGNCGNTGGIAGAFLRTSLYDGDICFVPSYSALDVPTVTPSTAFAKYVNNITDNPSLPRVMQYLAQANPTNSPTEFNLNHLTFTARNSEWIFDQMEDPSKVESLTCSGLKECSPLTIANPALDRLCAGSSVTLSIPNLPAGTPVSWSTSPAGYLTPETGSGPTFTTTATNTQGTVTITALVGSCQASVTTSIGVGPAPIDGNYYCGNGCSSTTGPVQGQLSSFTIVPPGNYTLNLSTYDNRRYGAWQGQVDGGRWYTYNNNISAVVTLSAGQRAQFTVPFSGSSCGASSGTFTLAAYSSYRLVATPNPASSELTVTAVDEDQPETSTTPSTTAPPFEAELYDNFGKKVKASKSDKGKAKFDVRELLAGLYNVRAGKGKEAISKHIEITH